MRADYHTHTRWCKHGVGEIEDYVKKAISSGLEEIAITEHVPHRDNLDHRRIQWEEFYAYNRALDDVIKQYGDKIRIIKGFECEYYPEVLADYKMFRDEYGYKLLILGQHRSGIKREVDNFAAKSVNEMQLYADEVCEGLATGLFAFLAHPELALQEYEPGWDSNSERIMRQIFATCEKLDIPIEINANGLRDGRAYPSKEALLLSKEYNLKYLINSDAHQPEHYCDSPTVDAERFAYELGIQPLEFLYLQK